MAAAGSVPLTRRQWRSVLDRAAREGYMTEVSADDLLPRLREGGLSSSEAEIIQHEVAENNKMSALDRFLRTRPALEAALVEGLRRHDELCRRVCEFIAEERRGGADVATAPKSIDDPERVRSALRSLEWEVEVLGEWALPYLHEFGCLSHVERDRVRRRETALTDVLVRAPGPQLRGLTAFLSQHHRDMLRFLHEECGQPVTVYAEVVCPTDTVADDWAVTVPLDALDWAAVGPELARVACCGVEDAVAVQRGCLYHRAGSSRRGVWCPVQRQDDVEWAFVDAEDARPVAHQDVTAWTLVPVSAGGGIRLPGGHGPALFVHLRVRVAGVSSTGRLQPGPDPAPLHDPRAVLLLRGLLHEAADGATRVLLEVVEALGVFGAFGSLVDVASGRLQRTADDAAGPGDWHRLFVVLRAGDSVPRFRIPEGETVECFARLGAGARVERNRVEGREPTPDVVWATPTADLGLREALTRSMRRRL